MSPLIFLKLLFPGYRNKWKKRTIAMLKEINILCSEINFANNLEIPEIEWKKNNLKVRGFKTSPDYLDIYSILKPWLPENLHPNYYRLILDIITRYKYPHMRPDLSPEGFKTEELFGFHGQHKDSIKNLENETDKKRLADSFLPKSSDIIIDCGSYIGLGDLSVSGFLTEGKILAIEASKDCYELLEYNISVNNRKNIIPLNNAIWEKKCFINLNTGNAQSNSLIDGIATTKGAARVEALSIDEIVESNKLPYVSMLSLTLNGAEVEAIKGASYTLKKFKPRICLAGWYFRNNQRIADILEPVIKEYDYDIFVGHRGNFMALPK